VPLAVAGRDVVAARVVRNFDDFPEELVRLLLARARVSVAIVDRVRCEAGNLVAMGCSLAGLAQARLLIRMQRMHPQFPSKLRTSPTVRDVLASWAAKVTEILRRM
jgi:hypothetical protein